MQKPFRVHVLGSRHGQDVSEWEDFAHAAEQAWTASMATRKRVAITDMRTGERLVTYYKGTRII